MTTTLKSYRFSYLNVILTLILFSTSFISHKDAILITILFLLIVNITCFSNEYLVMKYYQKNQEKNPNKGYALFIMIQIVFTALLFIVFNYFF